MPRPRPTLEKKCPDCKQVKSTDEFYRGKSYEQRSGGLSPYCKPCMRDRNRKRTPDQVARYREQERKHRTLNYEANAIRMRANTARRAARLKAESPAEWRASRFFEAARRTAAPNVTVAYLASLFTNTSHCQCCGKVLHLGYVPRGDRRYRSNPDAPSIDRVNNRKGYTHANIAVICWQCNFRKTDLTLDDLEMLSLYIKRYGDFSVGA